MKRTIEVFITLCFLGSCVFSQKIYCQSKVISKSIRCANNIITYENITVRKLKGKVSSPLDKAIIIEIYKVSKKESGNAPYRLTIDRTPYKTYETNKGGAFYIGNFPDSNYVLKFGTSDGEWNCTWKGVRVLKTAKDRKIEVPLEPGT